MRVRTENVTGLKQAAEAAGGPEIRRWIAVGERSQRIEARPKGLVDCWEVIMLT